MNRSDEISFISVENQSRDFPKHFHETFCISLIRKGIEKMELNEQFLYTPDNSISITNPYEVHANPLADKDNRVSFDTIYVSPDLMSSVLDGKIPEFSNRQINDPQINSTFKLLLNELKSGKGGSERLLKDLALKLNPYSRFLQKEKTSSFQSDYLSELLLYIEQHLEDKIYLDELAKITHLNQYGFARKFKSLTGMTPMSYVLMKRVFSARAKITPDCDLTDLAYSYNFTDAAHFSHCFKRYVGISPREYKKQLSERKPGLYK